VGSRRKLGVGWLAVLVGVALLVGTVPALGSNGYEECSDCCFEDVVVRGAGAWWANARYEYKEGWLYCGRPEFYFSDPGPYLYCYGYVYYETDYGPEGWYLWADIGQFMEYCYVEYYNSSAALTPPSTGWVLIRLGISDDTLCGGDTDGLPAPRLSGGEPCGGGEIVPGGLEGFLDRGWPEGEEPPEVGELVVSATYEVGELISGCCSLVDGSGAPVDASYLTLSWYAVTIGDEFFDVREPIDSRLIYEEEGGFCFSIPTEGFAPGYYDIRLGAPFVDHQWLRVEVVAPAE